MDNINLDPKQIQQMILMLQAMLPKDIEQTSESPVEPKKRKTKNNTGQNKSKLKPEKLKRENKFEAMPEFRMHKEDIAIDKKLAVLPPVPRARPFEMINVVCRVCGRREEVNPALVTDSVERYKCNNCSTGAG